MITPTINEIASHIRHGDISLSVRRMLDLFLDTGDPVLIKEAIQWSKAYRQQQKISADPSPEFYKTAESLLEKAAKWEGIQSRGPELLATAEHISKQYRRSHFKLKPISLQINTGDILGVVGENGNGKTTLLRCLAGQLALDQGEIRYRLLKSPDYYTIKSHIAFIPQRIPRWYGLLKDNLHFSAAISGIKGETNQLMVDFMLERLNLTDYAHLNWNQISSGYRTRFEIARILLQKPRLLILDEPLANLDINAQQTILTDLKYMAKSVYNPMGVLMSSQQLHEVEKVADTVLFIKRGDCIVRSKETKPEMQSYVLEVETSASRDSLSQILDGNEVSIQYNGGFYTITSSSTNAQELVAKLVEHKIPITYFRDITYSTKRFF